MAGQHLPTGRLDVEKLLSDLLDPFGTDNVPVRTIKPQQQAPYRCGVFRAELGGRVTPISRYCRVSVQGWAVRADGSADLPAAFDLAHAIAVALEAATLSGPILAAELDAGPYRVTDRTSGVQYANAAVLLEVLTS